MITRERARRSGKPAPRPGGDPVRPAVGVSGGEQSVTGLGTPSPSSWSSAESSSSGALGLLNVAIVTVRQRVRDGQWGPGQTAFFRLHGVRGRHLRRRCRRRRTAVVVVRFLPLETFMSPQRDPGLSGRGRGHASPSRRALVPLCGIIPRSRRRCVSLRSTRSGTESAAARAGPRDRSFDARGRGVSRRGERRGARDGQRGSGDALEFVVDVMPSLMSAR